MHLDFLNEKFGKKILPEDNCSLLTVKRATSC